MPRLYRQENRVTLGEISAEQIEFLATHLHKEYPGDQDFYINRPTIEILADKGADAKLLELLRTALGERDSVDIAWDDRVDAGPQSEGPYR